MTFKTFVDNVSEVKPGSGINNTKTGERFIVQSSRPTGRRRPDCRHGSAFARRVVMMHEVEVTVA